MKWVARGAVSLYGPKSTEPDPVVLLCKVLRELTPEQQQSIIYDAHNRNARDLADWWEEHQAADQERERHERDESERKRLKQSALAKLTPEEIKALGLNNLVSQT